MEQLDAIRVIRHFVMEHYAVRDDDPDFSDRVHLFDYGYVDSFGAVELTEFIETHFGITIEAADLIAYPLNTVEEIAAFALRRQKGEV